MGGRKLIKELIIGNYLILKGNLQYVKYVQKYGEMY